MLSAGNSAARRPSNYSGERNASTDTELVVDPALGSFFPSDNKKQEDLNEMLDSNKDNLKLEAMKQIIGMIAKGRDASNMFPAVVKNVVSKNIEVKKLVYVYLERYAEEQQDLALLSISTFQRALKEPNQLIRAGALRVLSSIRVKMISPIVMLAIQDASSDMSPYVRKTAAHAIPKLYALDNELKPELIVIVQKFLSDKTVLVIGSAVMAFSQVCPDRVDLIHHVYRKLCTVLADVDEWGQVTIVNMLTRYARMQFTDPNLKDEQTGEECDEKSAETKLDFSPELEATCHIDTDHRLLLRCTRPLLQSRNAAVVMSVAQLYYHVGQKPDNVLAAKALVRLLRSHAEVQSVVLNVIVSITVTYPEIYECYLKSFFVRTSDLTHIKLLKLQILTNLANISNVRTVLREFQTYVSSNDSAFVGAAIQAIGKCACTISQITEICLDGLVSLLSSTDDIVVAESVVVIKRLLQNQAVNPKDIVTHMARLFDQITVAPARASILWLLGEHCDKSDVAIMAPDILRKIAKSFLDEESSVKAQALNLAVRLYITNRQQTELLCNYVFTLAKYDVNYDIRDKVRFLRHLFPLPPASTISETESSNIFILHIKDIFLKKKPTPLAFAPCTVDNDRLQLGSLSHYIKQIAVGYEELPPFSEHITCSELRNVDNEWNHQYNKKDKVHVDDFWKTDDHPKKNQRKTSQKSRSGSSSQDSSSSSSSDIDSDSSSSISVASDSTATSSTPKSATNSKESTSNGSVIDVDSEGSETSCENETGSILSNENVLKVSDANDSKSNTTRDKKPVTNFDLLIDLSNPPDNGCALPVLTPTTSIQHRPIYATGTLSNSTTIESCKPAYTDTENIVLLNKADGRGLSATYRYTRYAHIFSSKMVSLNIVFTNHTTEVIKDIRLGRTFITSQMAIHEFNNIAQLFPGTQLPVSLGVDFNDSTQTAVFEIVSSQGNVNVKITPRIGELMRPVTMNGQLFTSKQSRMVGMHEHSATIQTASDIHVLSSLLLKLTNVGVVEPMIENGEVICYRFAGQTLKSSNLVLISLSALDTTNTKSLIVNCENLVYGSVLLNDLKSLLS